MVAAAAPLYCTPLIGHTLDAEMEELKGSTRLAAAWIHTNGVDNGIAVISYYGISKSNSDTDKEEDERKIPECDMEVLLSSQEKAYIHMHGRKCPYRQE